MDDPRLAELLRSGDPASASEVLGAHGAGLLGLAQALLADPGEAADAVHDSLVLAAQRVDQLSDPTRLRAWLYALVRNDCIRRLRQAGRLQRPGEPYRASAVVSAPDEPATEGEAASLVAAAIQGLADRDRMLIELSHRQGLTGEELSAAAGLAPAACQVLLAGLSARVHESLDGLLLARWGPLHCLELADTLEPWDRRWSVEARDLVLGHAQGCETCQRSRSTMASEWDLLAAAPPPEVGDELPAALAASIAAPDRLGCLRDPASADLPLGADGFPPPLPDDVAGELPQEPTAFEQVEIPPPPVPPALPDATSAATTVLAVSDGTETGLESAAAAAVGAVSARRSRRRQRVVLAIVGGVVALAALAAGMVLGASGDGEPAGTTTTTTTTSTTSTSTTSTTSTSSTTTTTIATTTSEPAPAPTATTTTTEGDTDPPTVSAPTIDPATVYEDGPTCAAQPGTASIEVEATDASGIDTVTASWSTSAGPRTVTLFFSGGQSWSGTFGPFPVGTVAAGGEESVTVAVRVTDQAGNATTVSTAATLRSATLC